MSDPSPSAPGAAQQPVPPPSPTTIATAAGAVAVLTRQPEPTVPPAAPSTPAKTPEPQSQTWKTRALAIGIVVVLAVVAVRMFQGDDGRAPVVGDCLPGDRSYRQIPLVACADATAVWRVAGIVKDKPRVAAYQADICEAFPDIESTEWSRTSDSSGTGDVYCLTLAKK
ncbi:LppU/SCO3897 family protein [Longispora albida]|uniref:LppU/SCO3897 family protein n=1 Tax=Longispora albida TaxID=203523 RepID=UPI0003740FC4|nr:hypothetical protein [Longispora albida]